MFYKTICYRHQKLHLCTLISGILHHQHSLWGMIYQSCVLYESFIFIKWRLSLGRPYPHSAKLEVIFFEASPTIGTSWTRTHITHKKLLEEIWNWLWGGYNSNANVFHQWFVLGAKFWGKRRTNYWLFALFYQWTAYQQWNQHFFQNNIIRGLKKTLQCSIQHYRETLPMIPPLVFYIDSDFQK